MATNLTTPAQLARQIREMADQMLNEVKRLESMERLLDARTADGIDPLLTKKYLDGVLVATGDLLETFGDQLGVTAGTPVCQLPLKSVARYAFGAPPGVGYLAVGGSRGYCFTSDGAAMSPILIEYYDCSPNYNMFIGDGTTKAYGPKAGDVINVSGCRDPRNNGRYEVRYNPAAKGTSLNDPTAVATYGPNDTSDTFYEGNFRNAYASGNWVRSSAEWAITGGANAVFTASGLGSATLTHALSGMVEDGVYVVQFDLAALDVAPVGALQVSIGGDFYFEIQIDDLSVSGTYSLVTNSPSATPTLTFTAVAIGASTSFSVNNVIVSGFQGLVVSQPFYGDSSNVSGESPYNDDTAIITLEQTAA